MALDLKQLEKELAAAPLASPYSWPLTCAVLCDVWRMAGRASPKSFAPHLQATREAHGEKLGVLAHLLASTSLREESVRALAGKSEDPEPRIKQLLDATQPLTAEMVRANAFRREELVRRWLECVQGEVVGETREQAAARLEQLDYRKTLNEFAAAEKARKDEAERRAKLLKEAEEKELAARGWRE